MTVDQEKLPVEPEAPPMPDLEIDLDEQVAMDQSDHAEDPEQMPQKPVAEEEENLKFEGEECKIERMIQRFFFDVTTAAAQTAAQAQREAEENARRAQRAEQDHAQDQIRMRTDFNRHGPPKFQVEVEPEKADLWVQEREKIFEALHTPDGEKMNMSTFMLKGDVEYWWSAKQLMTASHVAITWDSFKGAFMEKYFPETAREDMEYQFLGLRQGAMTVGEYTARLETMSMHFRFFQAQVDELYLCNRFMRGLRNDIEESVRLLGIRFFQQLVEKAREVETTKNRQRGRPQSGGPIHSGQGQAGKFDKGKAPQRKPYQRPADKVPFAGKGGTAIPKEEVACFKRNQKGHCPKECGKEIMC
ncbi:uncharacterized protein LOC130736265 [Lotus japonicus]|uniref:uncharacterized protein LOC130736265 n=1 Tax=Lotus japonicus TaxID=34305 RepID=UPI0025846982|nr:uncharacterized protein LOC130736265 [Lotus japonicus]